MSNLGSSPPIATTRRGGLSTLEIGEIIRLRGGSRPAPWQFIATKLGRTVDEVKLAVQV